MGPRKLDYGAARRGPAVRLPRERGSGVRKHEAVEEPEEESIDWSDARAQRNVDLELVYQAIRSVRQQIGEWKIQRRLASAGIVGGPRTDACDRELAVCNQRLAVLQKLAGEVKASEDGLAEGRIVVAQVLVEASFDGSR